MRRLFQGEAASVIWLLLASTADAEVPNFGQLIGVQDGDILSYECTETEAGRITCDFVQILLSNKAKDDDWHQMVESIPAILEKNSLDSTCSGFILPLGRLLSEGPSEKLWNEFYAVDDRDAFLTAMMAEREYYVSMASTGATFCRNQNEANLLAFLRLGHDREALTCTPFINRYQQTYVMVSPSLWVVESSPSGPCGIINTSRFTLGNADNGFWEHVASKIITNKEGKSLLSCSELGEVPQKYSWKVGPKRIDCMFID